MSFPDKSLCLVCQIKMYKLENSINKLYVGFLFFLRFLACVFMQTVLFYYRNSKQKFGQGVKILVEILFSNVPILKANASFFKVAFVHLFARRTSLPCLLLTGSTISQ